MCGVSGTREWICMKAAFKHPHQQTLGKCERVYFTKI